MSTGTAGTQYEDASQCEGARQSSHEAEVGLPLKDESGWISA